MAIHLKAHAFAGNPLGTKNPSSACSIAPNSALDSLRSLLLGSSVDLPAPDFKILPFRKGRPLASSASVPDSAPVWRLGWFDFPSSRDLLRKSGVELSEDSLIFLGSESESSEGGVVYWAVDVSAGGGEGVELRVEGFSFVDLRTLMVAADWTDQQTMGELALAGHAKTFLEWHSISRFCGQCGSRTVPMDAGRRKQCVDPACKKRIYPRVDPVVIMLVIDKVNDRVLLSSQARYAPRMWTCLSGFIEPGESLEEAVRRETMEETGIEVVGPKSMPCQLMMGFFAYAKSFELRVDKGELEDARWYSREALKKALASADYQKAQRTAAEKVNQMCNGVDKGENWLDFKVESTEPMYVVGPFSLAFHLISSWVNQVTVDAIGERAQIADDGELRSGLSKHSIPPSLRFRGPQGDTKYQEAVAFSFDRLSPVQTNQLASTCVSRDWHGRSEMLLFSPPILTRLSSSLTLSVTLGARGLQPSIMAIHLQAHAFAGNPLGARNSSPASSISPNSALDTLRTLLLGNSLEPPAPDFKILPFRKGRPLASSACVPDSGPVWRLGWFGFASCRDVLAKSGIELSEDSLVYLGSESEPSKGGVVYWAVDVSAAAAAGGDEGVELREEGFSFVDLRTLMIAADWADKQAMGELAIGGHAKALLEWHSISRFCGHCGSRTAAMDAGRRKQCIDPACKKRIYPRVDPVCDLPLPFVSLHLLHTLNSIHGYAFNQVVIMLVIDKDKDRALLGCRAKFALQMWSCLAGFIEPGESLEEAVRRETMEETGIEVGEVIYHSSQPWPDAQWHSREAVKRALAFAEYGKAQRTAAMRVNEMCNEADKGQNWSLDFKVESSEAMYVPGPYAIAHHLISSWANQDAAGSPSKQSTSMSNFGRVGGGKGQQAVMMKRSSTMRVSDASKMSEKMPMSSGHMNNTAFYS
ncbi:hypothetical protein ACLOJK_031962 [Asimina triloba]